MSTITTIASSDVVANSRAVINNNFANLNTDKVEGPSASVDSEVALYNSTTGKLIKRASSTGIAKLTSGVLSAVTAPSGAIVGDTDSQTLTNKTLTSPTIKTWDGYNAVSDSWAYASATTITVPTGAATLYQKGDRIKLTQTTPKYFYVVAVADTLLTVTGGSDYTVANAAISSIFVSHSDNPIGFPDFFNYTPTGPTNTTLTCRFKLSGKMCFVEMLGSVTGAVTWTTQPTIPITASASMLSGGGDYNASGVGGYLDSGTLNKVDGITPVIAASATTVQLDSTVGSNIVTSSNPITWANNDRWYIRLNYEI